jgi:hypothetical protein
MDIDKEKTFHIAYYDYEQFKDDMMKLLENKNIWNNLDDHRNRLEKVKITIRNAECK